MPGRKYTDEQKAEALSILETKGLGEAAAQTGIPRNTIASWGRRAKVQTFAPNREQTEAAIARRRFNIETFKADAAEQLSQIADLGWRKQVEILTEERPSLDKVVGASKQAVHDLMLLAGEPTDRTAVVGPDQIAAMLVGAKTAFEIQEEKTAGRDA